MNYETVKTHLERAHAILIATGRDLDTHELGAFSPALKGKDWRMATAILEECGGATEVDSGFWSELLLVARELELPRYVARIEKQLKLAGQ